MDKDCIVKVKVEDLKYVVNNYSDATAETEDVLIGKTFYSRESKSRQTGTMNPGDYAPIQTISKNGVNLHIDENKNVDIPLDKSDVGLGNVDNTSDLEKPISKATSEALKNLKEVHDKDIKNLDNEKASLLEENTFVGKQNFNGETEVNSPMEVNANISINNKSLRITNIERDTVTTYFTDRITSVSGEEQKTVETILPTTSGTLLTDTDISIKHSQLKNTNTNGEKIDSWNAIDNDARLEIVNKTNIDVTSIFLQRNFAGIEVKDSDENDSSVKVTSNSVVIESLDPNSSNSVTVDKDAVAIIGNVKVRGTAEISGTVTVKDTETLKVKDNIIVTNSDGIDLLDLSGVAINKNSTDTYGVVYDSNSDAVKLGLGKIDVNGKFSFNSGEGSPIAVRSDASALTNNNLIKWDATNKKLIDSTISTESVADTIAKRHEHSNKTILDNTTASYTAGEKTKLSTLENYDDTSIRALITNEATARANADTTLETKITSLQNSIPTKVSQLTNDSNYITSGVTGLANYYDKTTIDNKLTALALTDNVVENQYVTSVSETAGKISVTRKQISYNELSDLPVIPTGSVLYTTTGQNTDGAMTQKATTDAINDRLVKSDFGIYVGSNDACSDSDGNFGQCSNIYNSDGTFYSSRKFLFNKDDFSQDGDDASKIYSISENIARTSDLSNYVPKKTATTGVVKVYCINGENGEDVCLVSMNGENAAIVRYSESGQINVTKDPQNANSVTRKSWVESQISSSKAQVVEISATSTAVSGTLIDEQLSTLQADWRNVILLNNEYYRLNDQQSDSGYLVYTHTGQDNTNNFFTKCLTITISTLGWTLTTVNMSSGATFEYDSSTYTLNIIT